MKSFRHAGDLGDIILSLPVIRALCGDDKAVVLLEAAPYTRQQLTPDRWCGIDRLMLMQPYIAEVRAWRKGEAATYNMNDFRARLVQSLRMGRGRDKHLTHWVCEVHGVPNGVLYGQWLSVDKPIHAAKVVFSRAGAGRPKQHVYQNPAFPWHYVWDKYHHDAVFIGTAQEHENFCATCGRVPHFKTAGLDDAARVIAGCELFVGNQTATHAIAEGLKKRIVLEVWPEGPNVLAFREGVHHGWDSNVTLPDI